MVSVVFFFLDLPDPYNTYNIKLPFGKLFYFDINLLRFFCIE